MIDEMKCLASYVTYRQLYDDGKKDVYYVVSKFIENIIVTKKLYSFGLTQLTEQLNCTFGFSIPEYVIKSAIKRIDAVTRENNSYTVNKGKITDDLNVSDSIEKSVKENEKISQKLIQFVENEKGSLNEEEKEKLQQEFCSFLLFDSHNGCSDLISAFIVENEKDAELQSCILKIKEGAVLFAGLNYNSNISDKSAWRDKMIIYVETEILFHLAGYNGIVFKRLAEDLFSLIGEMNTKSSRESIHVRYFKEVSDEIDNFFSAAQDIVEGKRTVSIGNYAMEEIVKGCGTVSDVIDKKTQFFTLLRSRAIIEEEEHDYYQDEYHKYNLETQNIFSEYSITDDKLRYIKHLNYVNILRKGSNANDLRKCRYVVMTETGKMLKIASDINKNSGTIPLAINMYLLTNRLWFDMNKGFGSKSLPSSFDVLTRARIVLSNILTQNVTKKYDEVKEKFENKKITEDQLYDSVIYLRDEIKKPEEISSESVENILQFITEEKINIHKSEKEFLEGKLQEAEREKKLLVDNIQKSQEENAQIYNAQKELAEREKTAIHEQLNDMLERKKKADRKVDIQQKRVKLIFLIMLVMYYMVVFVIFIKLNSVYRGLFSLILSVSPPGISFLLSIIRERKLSVFGIYKKFLKSSEEKTRHKQYLEYLIDIDKINVLQKRLEK